MSFPSNSRWPPQPTHFVPMGSPPSFSPPPPPSPPPSTITTNPLRPPALVGPPQEEGKTATTAALFVPAPSELPPLAPLNDALPLALPAPVVVVVSSPSSPTSVSLSDPSPPPTLDATRLVGKDRFWHNVRLFLHPTPGSMGVCGLLLGITLAAITAAVVIPTGRGTPAPPPLLAPTCCSISEDYPFTEDVDGRGWSYVPDSHWDTTKWGKPLGPTHWAELLTDSDEDGLVYPECDPSRRDQSPIALSSSTPLRDFNLSRAYSAKTFSIGPRKPATVGPGWEVSVDKSDSGAQRVWEVYGKNYTFQQVHFHAPSEHTLDGVVYPLEGHFLHTLPGSPIPYAVFSVLYTLSPVEEPNPFFAPFWDYQYATNHVTAFNLTGAINDIEPRVYRYNGTATAPPCRAASWFVGVSKQGVSSGQLAMFRQRYKLLPTTARPIQPTNGREVYAFDLA